MTSALAIRHVVDRAVRIATSTRSVTCIIIPKDVQELDAVQKLPRRANLSHSGVGYQAPRMLPSEPDLHTAAAILNAVS